MKASRILLALAVTASLTLAACGGGSGGSGSSSIPAAKPPAPTGGSNPANNVNIPAPLQFAWQGGLLTNATVAGRADPRTTVSMQLIVKMQNPKGLLAYAQQVSNPTSSVYRHFLTPTQIATQYGAKLSDYQAAASYMQSYGLHVSGWPQHEVLVATGAVGNFSRAFNTSFQLYKSGNQTFVGPVGSPHLSRAVAIGAVYGLAHVIANHTYFMGVSPGQADIGNSPQQFQRAFDFTGPRGAGITGSGINVAIVGTGPISPADAQALSQQYNAQVGTITQMPVTDEGVAAGLAASSPSPNPGPSGVTYPYSSGFQTPPPVTAPCHGSLPTCNPEDTEAQIDSQTVASLATGANVLFYLAYNPNDCFLNTDTPQNNTPCAAGQGVPGIGIEETDAEMQQVIADDTADVVSMSFGNGEPVFELGGPFGMSEGEFDANGDGFGPIELATMAAEGMAVFVSSGDSGAYECAKFETEAQISVPGNPMCVSYPASDPSVVSVGGVTGPLNANGTLATQFTGWGEQTQGGFGGSGGGVSLVFSAPPWQSAAATGLGGNGMRLQPDISMMGDPATGMSVAINAAFNNGGQYPVLQAWGGTSLAAPQMAAMWSLVLQACKQDSVCGTRGTGTYPYRLGNPAPLMYGMYKPSAFYGTAIEDVLYGDNGLIGPSVGASPTPAPNYAGYNAGPGYDMVTGLGVPMGGHFIDAVLTEEGSTNPVQLP